MAKTRTLGTRRNGKLPASGAGLPLVREVLSSPGRPMDQGVRASMEPRFGHDFGRVRVHTDEKAASSAFALGSRAYTLGRHIVFGAQQYAPDTLEGRRLLAHELSHVSPGPPASEPGSLRVAAPDDVHERAAAGASESIDRGALINQRRSASAAAGDNVIHRSLLGGILGGAGGALGGAILGGLVGGPIGAVVGGLVGLVGGALLGNAATTRSRSLTEAEIAYAKDVFRDSVDYSKITITRDSLIAVGAPRTIGNTINLKSDWGHFKGDTLDLTEIGMTTLIHEMGHVWQYQNGGLEYIPDSIIAQISASFGRGSRNAAYDWRSAQKAGIPWENWNPEQQAEAIEDYNKLLRRSKTPSVTLDELAELAILLGYIEKVRKRQGAPGSKPARPSSPSSSSLMGLEI